MPASHLLARDFPVKTSPSLRDNAPTPAQDGHEADTFKKNFKQQPFLDTCSKFLPFLFLLELTSEALSKEL